MEQLLYERPREKLHARGVKFLTLAELVQLVLGAGSATASAAKLARMVQRQLGTHQLSYELLMAVKGIGDAKACQLLAAVELGGRINASSSLTLDTRKLVATAHAKPSQVLCIWLDGSSIEIDRKYYDTIRNEHSSVRSRRILADALAVSARSIVLCIGKKKSNTAITTNDLSFMQSLTDAARLLQIKVADVYISTTQGVQRWSNE